MGKIVVLHYMRVKQADVRLACYFYFTFKIVTDMQFKINRTDGHSHQTVTFTNGPTKLVAIDRLDEIFIKIGGQCQPDKTWLFPMSVNADIIEDIIFNTCFQCGGIMTEGIALQVGKIYIKTDKGLIEQPDPNENKLISVRKCSNCGHSHT